MGISDNHQPQQDKHPGDETLKTKTAIAAGHDIETSSDARVSADAIQRLVDQSAGFNLFVVPDSTRLDGTDTNGATAFVATAKVHRFEVVLQPPTVGGVLSTNIFGEAIGTMDIRWFMIPDSFVAHPDRQPPATRLDPTTSQRFAMQETTFRFGDGRDGFKCFGTGRTFPMMVGNHPRVVVSAIGTVMEGFGRFGNHEGNCTICGDLTSNGFQGNILVRFQDSQSNLRVPGVLSAIQAQSHPDPQVSYFLWAGQKGEEQPGLENHFSFAFDGNVRGMNITTQQKILHLDCAASGDFQTSAFLIGNDVIGTEIGFGRLSVPNASQIGTQLNPTLFEGVAKYTFFDSKGNTVGAVLTSLVEGRRFDMSLPGASAVPALRFGFFGPIIWGSGCFEGVEGIFYGASGSVFNPPPATHTVTHFYMMRLNDPTGKFRVAQAASTEPQPSSSDSTLSRGNGSGDDGSSHGWGPMPGNLSCPISKAGQESAAEGEAEDR